MSKDMFVNRNPGHRDFHGESLRSSQVNGFFVSETFCGPELQLGSHSHENAAFCVVLDGGFFELRDRKEKLYSTTDIVYRPPGQLHANRFLPVGGRFLNIEVNETTIRSLGTEARNFNAPGELCGGNFRDVVSRIRRELIQKDPLTSLAIEALGFEFLIEASRNKRHTGSMPKWIGSARDLLHERFAEALSLNEIAVAVNVHPAHLARTFRRYFGETVGEYIRRLRLEFVRTRLASTDEPISSIALDAGFYDQCHLSRSFKRHTGLTPASYRSEARKGQSATITQS